MTHSEIFLSFAAGALAALISAFLTWTIRPALLRVALARPNARSSHRIPTPQGGGIAVIAATLIVAGVLTALAGGPAMKIAFAVFGATLFIVAAALCGALLGFAPFNRPVAKIFLGDVGSLPVGLLLGWCLLQLAYDGHFAAALLLPLYYLIDATATLLRRMRRREPFWAAHRSHFYQQATDNGFSVRRVVGEVFTLNVGLALLAMTSIRLNSTAADV